jgi:transcriptional regulator of acetoin/glycerol metabolism
MVQRVLADLGDEHVLRARHLKSVLGATRIGEKGKARSPDAVPAAEELRDALERCEGNVAHVAAFFGKHRKQVYRWLEKYDLDPARFRR